jgi:exopolysaccharide/PEP-CTERM locus tyrosine autokinase
VHDNVNPDWLKTMKDIVTLEAAIARDNQQINDLNKQQKDQDSRIVEAIKVRDKLDELTTKEQNQETAYEKAQAELEKATDILTAWQQQHSGDVNADIRRFPAELPLTYSSPKFTIIMLMCGIIGLFIGGALTLLAEMTDHTIKRPTDLRRYVDRPILAAIPALDIGRFPTAENLFFRTKRAVEADLESGILFDRNYVRDIRFRSIATEQIRKLRLSMQTAEGERIRTILVTSALAGEGKSTVAANLAVAISQMIGEYVLLIDADLRRPDLQNFFGMPPKPGLSEYLEHDIDLRQLLVKTEFDKLTLLQAGRVPANSTELLSSDRMHHLVREVKSRYPDRYIIIDSPPVLSTSEPNVLANQVDGVILVVRAGMTPREMVEDVVDSISPEKIMGIVMNDVRTEAGKYYSPSYV